MSGADRNFEKSVDSRRPEVYDLGHRTAKALWTVLSTAPFLSAFRQAEAVRRESIQNTPEKRS